MIKKTTITYLFLLTLLCILAIQFASSTDVQGLGVIKKGDSLLLKQNCINVTYSNITSISVNGIQTRELISTPISMTLVSTAYQTYNFTNSTYIGQYIVTGVCDENGVITAWSYDFEVAPAGYNLSLVQIYTYIFFLFHCLVLTFFSVKLFKDNKFSKDVVKPQELYELKKRNEFLYYMSVLKQRLWIVGLFGIYLSIFLFTALLEQLVYNLGLADLDNLLQYVNLIFAWGLIPFTLFWFIWMIIVFYKTTTETMKWQFGAIGRGNERR